MITIVIADDHQIVRQGVRVLLETEGDFKVIGEAANGKEAVKLVKNLKPDVLVTDLIMPDINGIEVTRQVKNFSPDTKVIVLSMYDNESYVSQALESGAHGYVLKESGFLELSNAIRTALVNKYYLSPPLSEEKVRKYRQGAKPRKKKEGDS